MRVLTRPFLAVVGGIALVGGLLGVPAAGAATTYTVTSPACSGPGSLQAAIAAANANAGADIIDVQVDVTGLYVDTCAGVSVPGNIFAGRITESVTIDGNGHSFTSTPIWINSGGTVNPNGSCPSRVTGMFLGSEPAGAFEVGTSNTDNSAISVSIENLVVQGLNSLVLAHDNAQVSLDGVQAHGLTDLYCSRPAIESQTGASLTITNSSFDLGINWDSAIEGVGASLIEGGPGALTVLSSTFTTNTYPGAIGWDVSGGKTANIVSSQLVSSGGILILGDGTANIVNSIVNMGSLDSRASTDRIAAAVGATVNVKASTVKVPGPRCDRSAIIGACTATPAGFLTADSATLNLLQSAVGTGILDETAATSVIAGSHGGTFTADAQTWVQPVAMQSAIALKALFGQPALLTDPPGLPTLTDPGFFDYPATVTPLIGSPGALLDIITDSTCTSGTDTNKLVSPIDASCITLDALGNPRWDAGNSRRNIGAVQLTLAPALTLVGTGSGFVDLSWSRPNDPSDVTPVNGYTATCTPSGAGAPVSASFSGATSLNGRVNGLTNGTTYGCVVVATNTGGDGPSSNTVTGTPFGTPGTPAPSATPGSGQVQVFWTSPSSGGHAGSPVYTLLYRPTGSSAWLAGPAGVLGRTTLIPGLTNGTGYEFAVFAQWPDGATSQTGTTSATPTGTLPLRHSARPTSAHPSRWKAATLVNSSSTSFKGKVRRTVRCTPAGVATAGDIRYCTYRVGTGGSVIVTPTGRGPVRIVITLRAVPKAGVQGWKPSATWTRTWTSR